jgi:hypothetical protein
VFAKRKTPKTSGIVCVCSVRLSISGLKRRLDPWKLEYNPGFSPWN